MGQSAASGVYFYRLVAKDEEGNDRFSMTKKTLLCK